MLNRDRIHDEFYLSLHKQVDEGTLFVDSNAQDLMTTLNLAICIQIKLQLDVNAPLNVWSVVHRIVHAHHSTPHLCSEGKDKDVHHFSEHFYDKA